jgi:hypothetical protein
LITFQPKLSNSVCIIYNFIVFTQNYILIPRVTFFREERFNSFPKVDIFSPTRTAFKKISICLPCMNSELRGAIYRKHMLYSQYTKNRNTKTWEKFRKQRNLVTKSDIDGGLYHVNQFSLLK